MTDRTPMSIAIIGGASAVLGAFVGAAVTGWSELQLAAQKFNSDLVMKALEQKSGEQRLDLLQLLVETNLIKDPDVRAGVTAYAKSKTSDPSSVPQIGSTSPLMKEFRSGPHRMNIPSDVESMWVFYQSKATQNPSGCQRPPNADPIRPKAVAKRIDEFIKHASTNADIALVFTAFSPERGWDAAASEIRVNGKALKPMISYWCNSQLNYGYELELR